MMNFNAMMNEKNHVIDFYIQPIKIFGITIRKGYTITKFIKCECGESAVDRLIKSASKPNVLLQKACIHISDNILYRENLPTKVCDALTTIHPSASSTQPHSSPATKPAASELSCEQVSEPKPEDAPALR